MNEWAARRFWKAAAVNEGPEGFGIVLDGRGVRTPAKAPLIVPTRALAEWIAEEWAAQGDTVDPRSMPATRGANAAIDKVAVQHAEVADMLAAYGDSDLLCYRAEAPDALVARQAEGWDPMLDWAAETYGARLETRIGIMHQPQPAAALARLAAEVHGMTAFELAAFHDLVSLSGSLVLGLAATQNAESAERLWDLSRIDEDWQAEQWGADEDAEQAAAVKRESFLNAKRFYDASRG
jgi:chaperone required for assembly of F1-ATPase